MHHRWQKDEKYTTFLRFEVSGLYSNKNLDCVLLDCDAMQSCRRLSMFQKNVSPPIFRVEVICSSITLVTTYITWHQNSEDIHKILVEIQWEHTTWEIFGLFTVVVNSFD
jgi:hypothetical protein